jgi:hypothetical protein
MAHYALIDKNNIVVQVITGVDENETQVDTDGTIVGGSTENWEKFYASLPWFQGLTCKRTSYNGNIRKNYTSIGSMYDSDWDVFIPIKPYPSWKLDYSTFTWKAPVEKPDDGNTIDNPKPYFWRWSEVNQEWIKIEIPHAE